MALSPYPHPVTNVVDAARRNALAIVALAAGFCAVAGPDVGRVGDAAGFAVTALAILYLACATPLALGVFVLAVRPLSESFNVPVAVTPHHALTAQQLWGIAAAAALVGVLARGGSLRRVGRTVPALVAAVALCGIFGALLGPVTKSSLKEWAWVVLALGMFPLGMSLRERVPLRLAAHAVALSGIVVLALAITRPYAGGSHFLVAASNVTQLSAGYVTPHPLAFEVVAISAWTLVLAFEARSRLELLYALLLTAALSVIVFLTTIRTGEIGLVVLLSGAAIAAGARRGVRLRSRGGLAVGASTVLAFVALVAGVPVLRHRWLEIPHQIATRGFAWAGSGRGVLWERAFHDFEHNSIIQQIFGSGYYSTIHLTQLDTGTGFAAHTDPLEILVSLGVAGALLFGLLLIAALRLLAAPDATRRWIRPLAIAAFAAFLAIAVLTGFVRYTSAAVPGLLLLGFLARDRGPLPGPTVAGP